jgi:protease-4
MRVSLFLSDLFHSLFVFLRNLLVSLVPLRGPVYVLLDLSGPYPEHRGRAPWWSPRPASVEDVRQQLDVLSSNRHVAGVVLTMGALDAGFASLQSLRAALSAYRSRGARVVAYLSVASTRAYYLATAADAVVMPESGVLDLVGLTLEATFLGEALRRLGVRADLEQVGTYKGTAEPFVRGAMSPPVREHLNTVLDSLFAELVQEISRARSLDPARVRELIDHAPHPAPRAKELGLVDALLYEDELPAYLTRGGRAATLLPWAAARHRLRRPFRWRARGPAAALIDIRGLIQLGESHPRPPVPLPIASAEVTGHATVVRALRAAARDRFFGSILLTVDSPGGSAVAADLIWREVTITSRKKPVVAFLSNIAASGGYYAASGATRILCQPGTLTGSIGVVGGKFTLVGLAALTGIRREILARGDASTIASPWRALAPGDRDRLRGHMGEVYARFVDRVASGRGMTRDEVMAAADGRVWTGRQALELRLVDALGDFVEAVGIARELMGVPCGRDISVVPVRPARAAPAGPPRYWRAAAALEEDIRRLLGERVLAFFPWELRPR